MRTVGAAIAALVMPAVYACGTGDSPAAPTPPTPVGDLTSSGMVSDRIAGGLVAGSTITFTGPVTRTASVVAGSYEITGLVPGSYRVTIQGPSHVTHETLLMWLPASGTYPFTVLTWNSGRFGAVYDETFHRYFHQLARITFASGAALRKWVPPPNELYVVEGTVPERKFDFILSVLAEVNSESVPAMWCGATGPLRIVTGPDVIQPAAGQIVVRPKVEPGATGTLELGNIRFGTVVISVSPYDVDGGPEVRKRAKGVLAHELFHVAGAFHVCGGGLGENPFRFSPVNCPYPDSLMSNLSDGILPTELSAQDRLAACLINDPATLVGNTFPDTNPFYIPHR
jgi:hypothetical protein